MTLEEFREADGRSGYLYELAGGVLEVVEVPGEDHAQVIDSLHEAFSLYRRQHPGRILRIGHGSDVRFVIPDLRSDRHPDLAVIFRDAPLDERGRRRPALAVEVVSPGAEARRRDYEEKRAEYLAFGLLEYWLVDPELRQVSVLARCQGPGGPALDERTFRGDDPIVSPLLPGLGARVSDLWIGLDPGGGAG